jgi:peptidoglycan/LPS O-acetylase OafA/YrhL
MPGLDGLRGLAVAAVIAFHLRPEGLPGGFLGVDLFFVLSGFLITSLLLAEREAEGAVSLGAFWARRARRLLPALFLVLAAVAAYAATGPDGLDADGLRGDALATLGYIANWHSIVADHGYWDLFAAPSLLAHTWSLAIEEQLYVVWPLVAVLALRRGRRTLLATAIVLGLASAAAMIVLYGAGDDTARTYYGTDTRAAAVLAGAALATWGVPTGRIVRAAGAAGALVLALMWSTTTGTSNVLYEGGFLLCAVAACAVIAAVAQPGPLARVFELAPLRRLGLISYGIYLWHWPVFVVLTPDRTGVHGWPLLVLKLAVTLAISEASYRVVELPIRHGALRGWRSRVAAPAAAGLAAIAVLAGTSSTAPAAAAEPEAPAPPTTEPLAVPPVAGRAPRILVVGDSGAAYLGEGMARVAEEQRVEVRNAGTIQCGVATAGGRLRLDGGGYVPDPDWCSSWPDRWRAELAAFEPDIVLLVIAWPGLGDREVGGDWRHPCDQTFDGYYASEVRRALAILDATGADVVVADSPYLTLPVVQSDHAERVDCLNRIYRDEAAASGARVLGLNEWLCNGVRCAIEKDGATLRPDGIHFRGAGADIAADWVIPELIVTTSRR